MAGLKFITVDLETSPVGAAKYSNGDKVTPVFIFSHKGSTVWPTNPVITVAPGKQQRYTGGPQTLDFVLYAKRQLTGSIQVSGAGEITTLLKVTILSTCTLHF